MLRDFTIVFKNVFLFVIISVLVFNSGKEEPELRIMHLTVSPAFGDIKVMQLCGLQHIIALDEQGC